MDIYFHRSQGLKHGTGYCTLNFYLHKDFVEGFIQHTIVKIECVQCFTYIFAKNCVVMDFTAEAIDSSYLEVTNLKPID